MPGAHEPTLIPTVAIGLALAFLGGLAARRLGMPSIVGYLLAGVVVGPFTPGLAADADLAQELAELGVILLMFGVGLHFSLRDLVAVRAIAVPGAIGQIAVASVLGTILGLALGWPATAAIVLGLAVSVASTVVLIHALIDRGELLATQGRIAVGWLIVEDIFTVAVLVLLPSLAALGGASGAGQAGPLQALVEVILALVRAGCFVLLIVVVGTRVLPPTLAYVARLRDHEIFTLAAVAIALGIAYLSSSVFGVSLALGAFLAGAVVNESDTSNQVDADARPLREVFSVLFFVSVGMLFDPGYAVANVPAVVAVLLVIVVAKALAAFVIVVLLGGLPRVGLTVAAGLAQIGEFSFILVTSASVLGLFPDDGLQLVVSAALVSITLNPFLFRAVDPLARVFARDPRLAALAGSRSVALSRLRLEDAEVGLRDHAVVVGSGRVGRVVLGGLARRGFRFVVVSTDRRDVELLREQGRPAVFGDASNAEVLDEARLEAARIIVVAIPDAHAARLIVQHAREVNPRIALVVRAHDHRLLAEMHSMPGSVYVIHGEVELGVQMTRYTLRRFGVSNIEAEAIAEGLRGRGGRPWPLGST
jgi:CPA2 family monovalent cation:H+ antiporter-2